jgi:hypothetical protein
MTLIIQKISNHPNLKEIERTINIVGINMNSDAATFDIYYRIVYAMNGQDMSNMFNVQVPNWHIDNTQRMMVRDENFKPIPNPDFVEQKNEEGNVINEIERYVTMPAFDYVKMLIMDMDISIKTIISAYLTEEDKDGRFNF